MLLEILKSKTGYDLSEADSLAALGCQEAVPVLGQLLVELAKEEPDTLRHSFAIADARRLLEALLRLRNPAAVGFIRQYLQECADPKTRLAAERVLAHLELDMPVPRLIELFDAAGIGTEQVRGSSVRTGHINDFMSPGGDEALQSLLVHDFSVSADVRALEKLVEVAHHSSSAYLRHQAIEGFGRSPLPKATSELISLLKLNFPSDLRATWGWQPESENIDTTLKTAVGSALEKRTGQKFGTDHARWARWLQRDGASGQR